MKQLISFLKCLATEELANGSDEVGHKLQGLADAIEIRTAPESVEDIASAVYDIYDEYIVDLTSEEV